MSLIHKHITRSRTFQLKIRSLVLCKVTLCSGQGKAIMQLRNLVSMFWKLIWPWKKKIMLLWEPRKCGTCWELLSSLKNTWTAKGNTLKYQCRCSVGRCFHLYSILFYSLDSNSRERSFSCKVLGVLGTHSFLPLSRRSNMLSSQGLIS